MKKSYSHIFITTCGALGLALMVSSTLANQGQLKTDFGPVSLQVEKETGKVYGDYPSYQGKLFGNVISNGKASLTWVQTTSEQRCRQPRHGSDFWGTVEWQLDSTGNLTGTWAYCDNPPGSGGKWNGLLNSGSLIFARQPPAQTTPIDNHSPRNSVKTKLISLDAEEADLWHEARFQWGQYYDQASVKVIKADITCDGHLDYVAHRLNSENPDGPFYNIMVVTRDSGHLASEGVTLSFDGAQESLCSMPNSVPDITISVEHWDEGEIDAAMGGWKGICTEAIRVDDGMCDAPRYFWRTGMSADDNHPRLMFLRN